MIPVFRVLRKDCTLPLGRIARSLRYREFLFRDRRAGLYAKVLVQKPLMRRLDVDAAAAAGARRYGAAFGPARAYSGWRSFPRPLGWPVGWLILT